MIMCNIYKITNCFSDELIVRGSA